VKTFGVLTLLAILSPLLLADIVPTPGTLPVRPTFDKSDLVCKCFTISLQVLEKEQLGTGPKAVIRQRVQARVEIQDLYKSDRQSKGNGTIFVEFEEMTSTSGLEFSARLGLTPGETAVLFLAKSQPRAYEFADPFLGATSFHSFPQLNEEPGLGKLQHALAATLQSGNQDDVIRALQLLQGFRSFDQTTLSAVEPLCASEVPDVAIPALGVLLRTQTPESVERVKRYLDTLKVDVQPPAVFSVGGELGQIGDARALAALEGLASSRFVSVRYGAMDGIRRIRSTKSVPFLMAKLDDPDSTVQYVALITAAEILGKYDDDFAPSMYLFDKQPAYYKGLWKEWWAEEGSKLYSRDSS
jgi:hypothetical protein